MSYGSVVRSPSQASSFPVASYRWYESFTAFDPAAIHVALPSLRMRTLTDRVSPGDAGSSGPSGTAMVSAGRFAASVLGALSRRAGSPRAYGAARATGSSAGG